MKKIYFAIIVIALIVLYCVKSYVPYNGIDISHHNPINWNEIAKDSNIKFKNVLIEKTMSSVTGSLSD